MRIFNETILMFLQETIQVFRYIYSLMKPYKCFDILMINIVTKPCDNCYSMIISVFHPTGRLHCSTHCCYEWLLQCSGLPHQPWS